MILEKVRSTILRFRMISPGDRVVVAVSGGPDSVALLDALHTLGPDLRASLVVAHLDHGLRGAEAEADARFVEQLAAGLGLPMRLGREDVAALGRREKVSLEEAGRIARRRFLRQVAADERARRVALGHHRDDQAETVLLRLIAGSGRRGLSGMRPAADGLFVRPLLECTREEILEHLRARGLDYRTDLSNEDDRFLRNRLRRRVLPILRREFNPRVAEAIARTAEILREEDSWLEACARRAFVSLEAEPRALDAAHLARLAPPIARRVVRLALRRAGLGGRDLARARVEEALDLARRARHASVSIGGGLQVRYEYGLLRIETPGEAGHSPPHPPETPWPGGPAQRPQHGRDPVSGAAGSRPRGRSASRAAGSASGRGLPAVSEAAAPRPHMGRPGPVTTRPRELPDGVTLAVPGEAAFPELGVRIRARVERVEAVEDEIRSAPGGRAYLDAAALHPPLTVRPPRPGDRYRPLGAPGSRKLSDLWTDLKVRRTDRPRCLVVQSEGKTAWAAGLRPAHEFRVTDRTRSVVVLEALTGESAGPVLYAPAEIAEAVDRLAAGIAGWAAGREIVALGILHGSFIFLADLVRRLPGPVRIGFLDREGTPVARAPSIHRARVLVVEDILDTGESLQRVVAKVRAMHPSEVRTCVLFDKPAGRTVAIEADWAGLHVPDRWVVGYGLDQDGRLRNLPYLTWV